MAGWGSWNVVDPDGRHRRVVFNADGYALSDTYSPGARDEDATHYERAPTGDAVTRITVRCRASTGASVHATARVAQGEAGTIVRDRVRSHCAR